MKLEVNSVRVTSSAIFIHIHWLQRHHTAQSRHKDILLPPSNPPRSRSWFHSSWTRDWPVISRRPQCEFPSFTRTHPSPHPVDPKVTSEKDENIMRPQRLLRWVFLGSKSVSNLLVYIKNGQAPSHGRYMIDSLKNIWRTREEMDNIK